MKAAWLAILFWLGGGLLSPLASGTIPLTEKLSKRVSQSIRLDFVAAEEIASLTGLPHYLVFNLDNGEVYSSKGETEQISPASFTKIMTSQVALDLGFGDQLLTVTKTSANKIPTILGLREGEQLKLSDLLRASIATSANDAAATMAEGVASQIGLNLADFVNLMNQKASLLKMDKSHFTNPDGLDDPGQFSTLTDIAKLVVTTVDHYPEILAVAASDRDDIAKDVTHDQYYLPNWNGLLGVYPGVFGLKIAYTENAGYSTIVLAQRDGVRLAALLTGAGSYLERDLVAATLLDAGFMAKKQKPANLTRVNLNRRYKEWGDLARQIRANQDGN